MAPDADGKDTATATGGDGASAPAPPPRFGVLWKHPDFMKYWTGQAVSLFGTQITIIALPFVAILTLHGTTEQVGLLRFFEFLPFILFSLFVGVWLDRWRRKPIMMVANGARAVLIGLVPLLYVLDVLHIVDLYLIAFGVGIFSVFFDVGYLSYIPTLVTREHLVEANTKLNSSWSAAQVAGPGVGGILVTVLTAPIALVVDALSYVVGLITLMAIHAEEPPPMAKSERRSMLRELGGGLRDVFGNPYLRATAIQGGMYNFFYQFMLVVFIVYAVRNPIRSLRVSPAVFGFIMAAGAVGGLIGAMSGSSVVKRVRFGRALAVGVAWGTLPTLLIPAVSGGKVLRSVLFAAIFFVGLVGAGLANVLIMTLRQHVTPNRLLGRMNGSYRFVIYGAAALGPLVGGVLGTAMGLRTALWVAAIGLAASNLPILLSPIPPLASPPLPPEDEEATPPPAPATAGAEAAPAVAE
jgi:MFS family permease